MDTIEKWHAERKEYDLLLNKGVEFTLPVECVEYEGNKSNRFLYFFKKYKKIKTIENKTFMIRQPVLRVLDKLSSEFLKLEMNYPELSSGMDSRIEFNRVVMPLVKKNSMTLAKIVAIAVLGMEYEDSKKLKEHTELFYKSLTASKLVEIAVLINTISNLVDFTSSIRLLTPLRMAAPILVEEDKKV